jgi:hypothetical protein
MWFELRVAALGDKQGGDGDSGVVKVPGADPAATDFEIKFECQMYKVRDDEYLVDVQV